MTDFHGETHPAFLPGSTWDNGRIRVVRTHRYDDGRWDVLVQYHYVSRPQDLYEKDIWNFQVRHTPDANT